ncbi:O-antigen ligase family protein [Nocardioides sp. GY 10127]|uniref:O-antigen ligase family protein n=1 Tax=Nocardioides sp. GY 10127 TaxID=2569762 RepID=UPI0010A8F057|nr:O-antigen ligase family protein [Nocardioides sp. GY 10127]TIC81857.1 hypothetical protein E8D37_11830 [Nocardioides sp. GY 10127]
MADLTAPVTTGRTADDGRVVRPVLAALHPRDPLFPLAVLVVPLPVWWLLGMANLGWFAVAGLMALQLGRYRRLTAPPALGWWLLFCLWLVLSLLALGLNPTDTVAASASSRVVAVGFRFLEYASATVCLLWAWTVATTGGRPAMVRMARLLGVMLLWSVAGGLLGVVAPEFEVTSLVERLLPGSLTSAGYVSALVHPAAAQIQDVLGTGDGRPSAPFPYTNSWANAVGLLAPWAIVCARLARTRLTRIAWSALLVVVIPAAVLSLNRGLWLGLGLGAAFGLVLLLRRGHVVPVAAIVAGGTIALVVLALSPLGAVVIARQSSEAPSNDIRGWSIQRAFELAEESPVLGYGGTREQVGSLKSIAIGNSTDCANCGNLPIGTNGQLWFALTGQGFVGAGLWLGFHVAVLWLLWRGRRAPADAVEEGRSGPADPALPTIVWGAAASAFLALWFSLVYDRVAATGCLEMLAFGLGLAALTCRETPRSSTGTTPDTTPDTTLETPDAALAGTTRTAVPAP